MSLSKLAQGMTLAQQFSSHGALIAIAIVVVVLFQTGFSRILPAWQFFTHRYDFIKSNFEKTSRHSFSFNVLRHSVTVLKGARARKEFMDSKDLNSHEGYKILKGGIPDLRDIQMSVEPVAMIKRIFTLLRKDRLSDVMPTLFDDIQNRMNTLGKQGTIDPFKDIYDMVFQMTVRMASCRELASDLSALTKLQNHYWTLENSTTPGTLLFPWFPSSSKSAKEASIKAIYTMILHYINERKNSLVPSSDAIDLLLGEGISDDDIIQFVIVIIFAGVINTGMISCWILLYMSFHSQWKLAIRKEVLSLLDQYANPSEPFHKRLSSIPIDAWEDQMPTIDLVQRETLRIVVNGPLLRRNLIEGVGKIKVADAGEVPHGGFIAYPISDVHMNANIYTNPETFDPERFNPGREEDKREPYAFLGWGAGRHPCAGMKVAKLEIKMIVAMFVVGYEYDVVNSKGGIAERLPVPNYNDRRKASPKGEPCFIKFKRVVE